MKIIFKQLQIPSLMEGQCHFCLEQSPGNVVNVKKLMLDDEVQLTDILSDLLSFDFTVSISRRIYLVKLLPLSGFSYQLASHFSPTHHSFAKAA